MDNINDNKEKCISKALDAHGELFQREIANKINQIENYSIKGMEFPTLNPNSVIDILAEVFTTNSSLMTLVIECKKADPQSKAWVFFPISKDSIITNEKKETEQKYSYLTTIKKRDDNEKVKIEPYYRPLDLKRQPYNFSKLLDLSETIYVCNDGSEIYIKNNKSTSNDDRIYNGSQQVFSGFIGMINKSYMYWHHRFEKTDNIGEFQRKIFMPVLVTNADLRIVKMENDTVNIESGDADYNKLAYEKVDWLIYNCPIRRADHSSEYQQFNKPLNEFDTESDYENIFIVKSSKLKEFLDAIKVLR